ncbi:MAG: glycosyl hydrolase [Bacilli bacterium]|nr:glycosyl hydrolase [Bacilli bacterium]
MADLNWVEQAWNDIVHKVERTSARIGATFPHASQKGQYDSPPPDFWTAGFWPGLLWLIYKDTNNEKLKQFATECEIKLDDVLNDFYELDHDSGFMWSLTAVANYKLTKNPDSRRRALIAASHLAGRFNLKGKYIRAWNDRDDHFRDNIGWAIIDCLMNLPLLYWASEETKDPRFAFIAQEHANTVVKEFIRPDGSSHHIVCFDPHTGERLEAKGGQGFAPESAWSRGNSWALHGLTLSYLYTQDELYLQAAKRVAHFFIANLPDDHVPYWDFRLPTIEGAPRDSSAGAIAASGLIELARCVEPLEAPLYHDAAVRILKSLYENYGAWNKEEEGLLLHGTSHFPRGSNVDVPLIYGDYFFVEAISKLRGETELFW